MTNALANPRRDFSNRKLIGGWLLTGCFLIFLMVIIGGITRLTGSGLSITEWKPIMGAIPPMNDEEWQVAFEKYQQIPQFQKINYHFSLHDFKAIFWWEYIHRLLGRIIGIVFIIPFFFFWVKGMLSKKLIRRLLFLFLLGGLQGALGWFMVMSGLSERTSVSHIRLAIHLITAFITFGFTFYFALEVLFKKKQVMPEKMKSPIMLLLLLVVIQIIYGAFVAGLHAGRIFNTFPLMGGNVIPGGIFQLTPGISNLFDNPVTVQFIHRSLAYLIVILTTILFWMKKQFPETARRGINLLMTAVLIQFGLGIWTLLSGAEITISVIHQSGAFLLFSVCIYLLFLIKDISDERRVESGI